MQPELLAADAAPMDGFVGLACDDIRFELAADGKGSDGKPKLPTFSMVAYTGAPMQVYGWGVRVIIDLAGFSFPTQAVPIRFNHDPGRLVGHTESVAIRGGKVVADGVVSCVNDDARNVVEAAKNKFPWQASVGATADVHEFIEAGKTAVVNGNAVTGPLRVIRKATLKEISFVDLGADSATSASVAARAANRRTMEGEQNQGGTNAASPQGGNGQAPAPNGNTGGATGTVNASGEGQGRGRLPASSPDGLLQAQRAENERADAVNQIIASALREHPEIANSTQMQTLCKRATAECMSPAVVKNEILEIRLQAAQQAAERGARPGAPAMHVKAADEVTNEVLAASLLMACGAKADDLVKDRDFGGERNINAAYKRRNQGLQGIVAAALAANGVHFGHGPDELFRAMVQHGRQASVQAASYSTVNLPGILGTAANKILLQAFTAVGLTYRDVAQVANFKDFKPTASYRLNNVGEYAVVASTGKLSHGQLGEDTYTNQLQTRGQMLTIPRQMIVNDDLNAFQQLFAIWGRKAGIAIEKALYLLVCESSPSFYTTAQGNLLTTNALDLANLGDAEAALMAMTDGDGEPIYAAGAVLLVPPGLKYLGQQIFTSAALVGGSSAGPADNPFRGRFKVVSSPYLASAAIPGSSATSWYLLADPALIPAFQAAFLNGQESPTVETADASFDMLGISMRAYSDFGVARADYRGAIKNTA